MNAGSFEREPRPNLDVSEEAGTVSLEFALVLPAFVVFLALVLAAGGYLVAQQECAGAARAAAREAALGSSDDEVMRAGVQAGAGDLRVMRDGGYVTVLASRHHSWMGMGAMQVEARAVARCEPGVGCGAS